MLSSQTVSVGCRHRLEGSTDLVWGAPLKKAVLVELSYTKPWQMLPLVAMLLQICANVSGGTLPYMPGQHRWCQT